MPFIVNVPNAPGVPPVAFAPGAGLIGGILATADSLLNYFIGNSPQWGIFLNGAPVVVADTVVGIEYRQEWVIADYPVEQGSFESYDKVATPFDGRVKFVAGGSAVNRQALLDSITAIAGDLNIYDIVTPEAVYPSVSIRHYDYRRSATAGLGMIEVDVWCSEIRIATTSGATAPISSSGAGPTTGSGTPTSSGTPGVGNATVAPDGAAPTNGGTVQPTAPSGPQKAAIVNGAKS